MPDATPKDELADLIAELTRLAIQGAHQSAALGLLLVQKGVATQEELDQAMGSTDLVLEKLRAIAGVVSQARKSDQ